MLKKFVNFGLSKIENMWYSNIKLMLLHTSDFIEIILFYLLLAR